MKTRTRHLSVAAALVCCCLALTACGTERAGAPRAAAPESSTTDTTSDDQGEDLPDTTSELSDEALPDTTSDDQGPELPDTTSDDQGEILPDTTTENGDTEETGDTDNTNDYDPDGPPMGDTEDEGSLVPTAGPHRWFPMLREFRAYLAADASKADAAIADHVRRVYIRTPAGTARSEAVVRVDYGIMESEKADRTAEVFTQWRHSVYGDHGHVQVLGPAKTTADLDW
ncbi:hypothetical protein [Streptomyces sp. NPDC003077]|uniref:hypothetical protein n=1 Tax=Streptomyces sp. NPDC003077 TaxID=3154443 RepID=UPI0033B46505